MSFKSWFENRERVSV